MALCTEIAIQTGVYYDVSIMQIVLSVCLHRAPWPKSLFVLFSFAAANYAYMASTTPKTWKPIVKNMKSIPAQIHSSAYSAQKSRLARLF